VAGIHRLKRGTVGLPAGVFRWRVTRNKGWKMKDAKNSQEQLTASDKIVGQQDTRRGVIHKMVAAGAAFVTGLFVSSRASATDCSKCSACCNCSCIPPGLGNYCLFGTTLCFDHVCNQYVIRSAIYPGLPAGGCCTEFHGGLVCQGFCTPSHPC
jgi:hypothetical protein